MRAMSVAAMAESDNSVFRLPAVIGEELARTLSDRIIFLDLDPGTHLTEDIVCVEYNVSRSPVREAFRALESDGLVWRLARRGVRVAPMGRRNLNEVYSCRVLLEGLAARQAATNATETQLASMQSSLDTMSRLLRRRQSRVFFDANVAFSIAVQTASANDALRRIAAGIEKQALRYRYVAYAHSHEMLDLCFQGHSEVFEKIRLRKPAAAERCAHASIRRVQALILRVVDELWPDED